MTTKIPAELSSTPGISDSSDATAITIGSNEKVGIGTTSTDHQLSVNAADYDGIQLLQGGTDTGYIGVYHDGSSTGRIYLGGLSSVDIQTGNGGATDGTTRVRVDSDGLKFGSDTAAANALDDYEEGTFTPTVTSGITSVGYSAQTGYYTKIGNLVMFNLRVVTSSGNAQSSTFAVGNLPFTSAATQQPGGAAIRAYASSFSSSASQVFIGPASTSISFFTLSGTAFAGTSIADHDGFDLRITGIYRT